MKIVEEYNKKKLEDKNYKATKEELRAIRSINAHKNFGHAKKHEAENTLIKASQQADALKGKNKVVVSLVKDKNNFASSIEQEVTAKKAKEAMVEQTAKKDAQDKVIQEKYDEIKKLVANSNAVDKSETIEAISKIQKQIQDVQGHSKNKLAEEMNKKIDKLIEDLSKKKK